MVDRRTLELTAANDELQRLNKELLSSNDEIKELNENLEKMVKERTDKINDQLGQLMRYAHLNLTRSKGAISSDAWTFAIDQTGR